MPEIYFNAVHLQINSELCIFVKELHYKRKLPILG